MGAKEYEPKDHLGRRLAWCVKDGDGKLKIDPELLPPQEEAGIRILYQGVEIEKSAKEIDFWGNYIQLSKTDDGKVKALVQENANPSNFGTNDGVTDATVPKATVYPFIISSPTSEGNPFKIGNLTPGSSYSRCLANDTRNLIYATKGNMFLKDISTSFAVQVIDADGVNLLANEMFTLSANGTTTSGNISITISNFAKNIEEGQTEDSYQCRISVNINIGNILPRGGKFSVKMSHDNGVMYTQEDLNLFRHIAVQPSVGGGGLSFQGTMKKFYVSGVEYYGSGQGCHIDVYAIDNLNNMVGVNTDNKLAFNGANCGVPNMNFTSRDIIDLTLMYNSTQAKLQKFTSITNPIYTLSPTATITPYNATNGQTKTLLAETSGATAAIWTNASLATDSVERFGDEKQRIASISPDGAVITTYLSHTSLRLNDGLQVGGNVLKYPYQNFSVIAPNETDVDYTNLTGRRYFIRRFKDGQTKDCVSGKIVMPPFTESDLASQYFSMEMSIDGITWYDLTKTDAQKPGEGIKTTSGTLPNLTFEFPLGVSAKNNQGVFIKIGMDKPHPKSQSGIQSLTFSFN